jgi:hypothetical protein
MPHPSTFLKDHSRISFSLSDETCLRCHIQNDCSSCHAAHTHPGGAGEPKR